MRLNPLNIVSIAGLILGVMAATIVEPADYGLSTISVKWMALAAQIASTIAAFYTSPAPTPAPVTPEPLPVKPDDVDPPPPFRD